MTAVALTEQNLAWLLEDDEPSVQYRTLTEVLGLPADDARVARAKSRIPGSDAASLLFSAMEPDGSWRYEYRNQLTRYLKYLSTTLSYMAELGLTARDERVTSAVHHLLTMQKEDGDFHRHYSCYNGLLLRALNRLGFAEAEQTRLLRKLVLQSVRHDGGTHCEMKPKRRAAAPGRHKSCFRGSLKSLLAFAEDPELRQTEQCSRLAGYFLKRGLIFRTDSPRVPVVREITKLSFPIVYGSGLIEPLYALSVLGHGQEQATDDAWGILVDKLGSDGRVPLERSQIWDHVRCGVRGRPNKWLTLYAGIVEKHRIGNPTIDQPDTP